MFTVGTPSQTDCAEYSSLHLGGWTRVAMMITPRGGGTFSQQVAEVLSDVRAIMEKQPCPVQVTVQTVFLSRAGDQPECERLMAAFYGARPPMTNFVIQPPCGGAALAVEAWAIGGDAVRIDRFGPHAIAIDYDGVRRVYCAGITPDYSLPGVHEQMTDGLRRMRAALLKAGTDFQHVVRTWFYLGGITEPQGDVQRYQELNRARADYYRDIRFCCSLLKANVPRGVYPASTGIGMAGAGLVLSSLAVETKRPDVFLLPLENPQQTPAYAYHPKYSTQSPKFSRAIALVLGDYVTTWISGTASIVNSESRHPADIEKQTEQTIDNIERLISPENFALHRVRGGGARLGDMAKIRVYLKRAEDLARCKAVCDRRFGSVPAIYATSDVCRPELLVEIEGVAFARCNQVPDVSR
jgi:enamine deaminase RidA (YjgF/YER057c/UK114 family)